METDGEDFDRVNSRDSRQRKNYIAGLVLYGASVLSGCASASRRDGLVDSYEPGPTPATVIGKLVDVITFGNTHCEYWLKRHDGVRRSIDYSFYGLAAGAGGKAIYDHNHQEKDKPVPPPVTATRTGGDSQ